jgi:DNA polymerase III gamma/tau subunit
LQQVIEGSVDVKTFLGSNSLSVYINFVSSLSEKNSTKCIKIVNKIFEEGIDLANWNLELLRFMRSLLLVKSQAVELISDYSEESLVEVKELAGKVAFSDLLLYIDKFIAAQNALKISPIPQFALEIAIIECCGFTEDVKPQPPVVKPKAAPEVRSVDKVEVVSPKKLKQSAETSKVQPQSLPVELVKEKWNDVLNVLAGINNSIQSLLKQGTIVGVGDNGIELEVSYSFHKERLESPKNRQMIEEALAKVLGIPQTIKCYVNAENRPKTNADRASGDLTDYNVAPVSAFSVSPTTDLLGMFDGGLPIGKN